MTYRSQQPLDAPPALHRHGTFYSLNESTNASGFEMYGDWENELDDANFQEEYQRPGI